MDAGLGNQTFSLSFQCVDSLPCRKFYLDRIGLQIPLKDHYNTVFKSSAIWYLWPSIFLKHCKGRISFLSPVSLTNLLGHLDMENIPIIILSLVASLASAKTFKVFHNTLDPSVFGTTGGAHLINATGDGHIEALTICIRFQGGL